MKLSTFKKLLDNIRENEYFIDKLSELGIEAYNIKYFDNTYKNYEILFTEIYGEEGNDWINWYLYEQPHFQKKIELEGDNPDYHAWDENGNPMDLSTDDKLWEMLETEYAVGKKYHFSKKV